jgi:outer membrane protein OmpA-like peptidoglycan-associated protein
MITTHMYRYLATTIALVTSAGTAAAAGDDGPRVEVRADLGAGSMLSASQRDNLGYKLAIDGSLRPSLRIDRLVAVEASLSKWLFPSGMGDAQASLVGLGARFDPRLSDLLAAFFDFHLGWGMTGRDHRLMFDLGLGTEFALSSTFGLGPFLRYGQMIRGGSDVGSHPKFLTAGVLIAYLPGGETPPPRMAAAKTPAPRPARLDKDGDGVPDAHDECPTDPQGAASDPARRGCPLIDTDGDGVPDNQDSCAAMAAGPYPDPRQPGCPDQDDDKDGLQNSRDTCPSQHTGLNPDSQRPGCPMDDGDGDSVADVYDACPGKPGAPSPNPKKNGCPGLVEIAGGAIKIMRPVHFANNRDRILVRSSAVLGAVAGVLKALPQIQKVSIEGHTDGRGNADKNLNLSQRRAEGVRQWLIRNGVESERVESSGFGDTKPIASNRSPRGRSINRRVEFVITDPAQPATGTP